MRKNLQKAVKKWSKQQDVFATTKHQERKAHRLRWQDIDLDAKAPSIEKQRSAKEEAKKWSELQSPFHLSQDEAKPSGYRNDVNLPHSHGINTKDL